MYYKEYMNSGRVHGKLLYQLSKIGVPLATCQLITFDDAKIMYLQYRFATYIWNEHNTPIFTFFPPYGDPYWKLTQDKYFVVHTSFDGGKQYGVQEYFTDRLPGRIDDFRIRFTHFYITTPDGDIVDNNFNPLRKENTMDDKLSVLQNAFGVKTKRKK